MKRSLISLIVAGTTLVGCSDSDNRDNSDSNPPPPAELTTQISTSQSYEDIADAAVWVSSQDNAQNLVIVSLEEDGIAVFDNQGQLLAHDDSVEAQGADIRYSVGSTTGQQIDVLAVALPDDEALGFYAITDNRESPLQAIGTLSLDIEPEGVCLYKNVTTSELLVTGFSEEGDVVQYKLAYEDGSIKSALEDESGEPLSARRFNVGGELSACIIDDQNSTLFVAEQDLGIWAYGADAENVKERKLVDSIQPNGRLIEIEGLDLAYMADNKGYLIAGDEGEGYFLYDKNDYSFVSQFTIPSIEEAKSLAVAPDALWLANTELDEPVYEKLLVSDLDNYLATQNASISNLVNHRQLTVQNVHLVVTRGETTEVDDDGDAADDPAFWLHPTDPEKSLIIATNKQGGLMAYNLEGEEVQYLEGGEPNNVDLRENVLSLDGSTLSLAASSNRELNTIALYKIVEATEGQDPIQPIPAIGTNIHEEAPQLVSNVGEIYGLCMYQAPDDTPYVFVNGKDGKVEQWLLTPTAEGVQGEIVRSFSVESQPEGCVADDAAEKLYLGEENVGIWEFAAAPDADTTPVSFAEIDGEILVADVEGLTIYENEDQKYLIASSQGNNTYIVYDLNNQNQLIGSFAIIGDDSEGLDGASDTDGIHAVSVNLGDKYPEGMFIAQDWYNIDNEYELENQNFKMVSWQDIRQSLLESP